MKIGAFDVHEPLPDLREVHVISLLLPWLDAGSVGSLALSTLERYFDAKELGKLSTTGAFFDFTRYRPTVYSVEGRRLTTIPNSHIYYAHTEDGPDLLFLHMLEPHAGGEEYIESIVQVLSSFNVKRYCRVGGVYSSVPHTRPLRVMASPGAEQMDELKGLVLPRRSSSYQGSTSIMGLVGEELENMGVETLSLMVQLPQYLETEEDYSGTARLLEVICALYHLPTFQEDAGRGRQQYKELTAEMEGDPEIQDLVKLLEADYDARGESPSEEVSQTPLPPQVDQFLQEMNRRLEER